jgi:hypothetical protein
MRRDEFEEWLRRAILELQDGLSADQVIASASLFHDLGLDSLAFEKLLATIDSAMTDKDLTQWYVGAIDRGEDTFGSLVDFLIADDGDAARGNRS